MLYFHRRLCTGARPMANKSQHDDDDDDDEFTTLSSYPAYLSTNWSVGRPTDRQVSGCSMK